MKKASLLIGFLSLAGLVLPQGTGGDLPSVGKVCDDYVQAMGGKAALEKLNSRVMKGAIEVTTFGANGTFMQSLKAPDKLRNESEFEGYGTVVQACDGNSCWADDPQQGLRDLSGRELALYKRAADFHRQLHMKEEYPKATITGKSKVGEHEVYVMEGEPAHGGGPEKMYFDTQTGLLLKTEVPTEGGQMAIELSDYKEVDGVKLPHMIKEDMPELSLVITVQSVQHNVAIEDAKFTKPAASK